jgi:hypothetical protein
MISTEALRPHVNARGELIIPCEAAPHYRWWSGGQSIRETLQELGASLDVVARYVAPATARTRHDG